jgi:hypothetical protein
MDNNRVFYLCPLCFRRSEIDGECHEHRMVACDVGDWADERRKPIIDADGRVLSRAPRWFLEAVGRVSVG